MPEVTYVPKGKRPPMLPVRMWRAMRSAWTGPFSLKDPELNRIFGAGSRSAAGVSVTPETAFTFSAVYDAVNQIASDVAKMPLNHMKRLKNGGSEPYYDSKLYRLLKYQPNPEMGTMVFRRQLTAWALVSHGGFAEIIRDGVGRPAELWPLEPHRVAAQRPEIRGRDGKVTLGPIEYAIDGGTSIKAENMLHLQGLGYTPHSPYSLVDKARQTIGLALAAERFGASFFGNGSTFGGMLLADNPPNSEEEAKTIREAVESIHQGPDRAHKLAVLWGGFKYSPLGVKPNEAQMNELRDKQVEEVARFFRMPPSRLGLTKPGTMSYNSVEMANLDYYTGCLLDWITLWEEELCRKLIPAAEIRQQFIKHNANVFLRGDFKTRMDGYSVALDKGLYSRNEVRELEDMGPQEGEGGGLYLVQSAQVPLDKLVALVDSQIEKNTAPPPAPAPEPTPGPDSDGDDQESSADERARLAEALAAETRQRLEEQVAAREALETANAVTSDELHAMREQERQTAGMLATHVALAESLRAQATEAEAARREAEIAAANEQAKRFHAESAMADAERMVAAAQAERDAALALVEEARAQVETAVASAKAMQAAGDVSRSEAELAWAEAAQAKAAAATAQAAYEAAQQRAVDAESGQQAANVRAREAQAKAEAAGEDRDAVDAQRQAAEALAAEAKATAVQACDERARLAEALAEAEARAVESVIKATEAQAEAETRLKKATEAETARAEAIDALAKAEQAAAEAIAARDAAIAESQAATARAAQVDADAKQAEARIQARDAALLAASRAILVEAMGVLVRRECSQAKSKQATPEKLRAWLGGFAALNQPVYVERLAPVLRLHQVLVGSVETPEQAAETLAREHIAEFDRQLRAVLEAEPEEFHTALDRTLTRWESDRPGAVADRLLVEGIRHVR